LLRNGSDSELPFAPIVASGSNSANPHAVPTDRKLHEGDLLVIDWGAAYEGYISDLTRTFAIGKVDPEYLKIAELVRQANEAGRAVAKPEINAGEVDRCTRQVIEQGGYGTWFTHRTGHGIGLESHEPPYIFGANQQILLPGMTFTVEPGIYLPGRNGVRIEDNVVITDIGSETLSILSRELKILE
jgi:Xaa-Pro dipeptidase